MPALGRGRPIRANRLDESHAIVLGVISGAVAAFADADPTGHPTAGRILTAVAVAAVTWAAASAPWWAVSLAAGIAAVTAFDPVLAAIAGAAFLLGLWIGVRRRDLGDVRTVVAGVALNVLARSELDGFHGASALVGVGTAVLLFVVSVRRRPRAIRRIAWATTGAVATLAVIAVLGFGFAAVKARSLLSDGQRRATEGIAQLGNGEFAAAAATFTEAGNSFSQASEQLDQPWVRPASLVPVVAQNADAVTDLASVAATSSTQLGTSLTEIDPETLRLVDGGFDLAAIEAINAPLERVQASIDELDATVAETDSAWLLEPIVDRVEELSDDIDTNSERLDNATLAARVAPGLLGLEGPRRYLIMFTTPAEARGLGGFMGNFAEVVAENGQLTMTRFGRTSDLNTGGPNPEARVVTGPPDWLDQWGQYGFRQPDGTTGVAYWHNITMSPDFPSTAQVVAQLYPQSGGQPLDGVFAMDPYVLAAFLEFTGPITISATGQELNSNNVVDFLLRDQYLIEDKPDRVDLLDQVARVSTERLLSGGLPDPVELARSLGPLVDEQRLVGWSAHDSEQELFARIGFDGAMPDVEGHDGLALVINNIAANKLDTYLERHLTYRAIYDPESGTVTGVVEIRLTNTAPTAGLPDYVQNNAIVQPAGTSRSLVSVYTGLPVTSVVRDGNPVVGDFGLDEGWRTTTLQITLAPEASTTVQLEVAGEVRQGSYLIVRRTQPMVLPEIGVVSVARADGTPIVVR